MSSTAHRLPNLLLILADQWRADHTNWITPGVVATPHLDALAAESTAFTQAITVNPICMPARCALMTGKYPRQVGTLAMSGDLDPRHPTFVRALQQGGYHTAAIGKLHLLQGWPWGTPRGRGHDLVALEPAMREFGFDEVWEVSGKQLACQNRCRYTDHLQSRGLLETYRDYVDRCGPNVSRFDDERFDGAAFPFDEENYADTVIGSRACRWLGEYAADRPFCLILSFCGPHPPYDPPPRLLAAERSRVTTMEGAASDTRQAAVACAYRAMIQGLDEQIGHVLAALDRGGQREHTVVAFASDHGDMLGEKGLAQKQQPYAASVRIPLLVRDPARPSSAQCHQPVELTDLGATLLDYAGIEAKAALARPWPAFNDRVPARSLRPWIGGTSHQGASADTVREYAFAECNNQWQLLRSAEFAYIRWLVDATPSHPWRESLYALQADPGETQDLAGDPAHAAVLARFRHQLDYVLLTHPPCQLAWAPHGAG